MRIHLPTYSTALPFWCRFKQMVGSELVPPFGEERRADLGEMIPFNIAAEGSDFKRSSLDVSIAGELNFKEFKESPCTKLCKMHACSNTSLAYLSSSFSFSPFLLSLLSFSLLQSLFSFSKNSAFLIPLLSQTQSLHWHTPLQPATSPSDFQILQCHCSSLLLCWTPTLQFLSRYIPGTRIIIKY